MKLLYTLLLWVVHDEMKLTAKMQRTPKPLVLVYITVGSFLASCQLLDFVAEVGRRRGSDKKTKFSFF